MKHLCWVPHLDDVIGSRREDCHAILRQWSETETMGEAGKGRGESEVISHIEN
jgi:hypothetical protein